MRKLDEKVELTNFDLEESRSMVNRKETGEI
jgi:hypothetical protein